MQLQTTKTTIELENELVYWAKIKALNEGRTLREVIAESLKQSLGIEPKKLIKPVKIGNYALGGVKGGLRRVDLYDDL
jgi:hypothetical protein